MGAPSVYFGYTNNHNSIAISQEIMVPFFTPGTFYSLLNWNAGDHDNMCGYAGIQSLPNLKRTTHFSVWDPIKVTDNLSVVHLIQGAEEDRFDHKAEGGTGRGIKIIYPFEFKENIWYGLRCKVEHPISGKTLVSFFLKDHSIEKEFHVATIQFPISNCIFRHSYCSFLEDFINTPSHKRKYYLRNGRSYDENSSLIEWKTQRFRYDPNGSTNLNGGLENDSFFLESGGNTVLKIQNDSILALP